MQHKLFHISINAKPNSSSSQFGMAVVGATKAGILLPSTGPNVTTKYKRLSGFAWQAFCFSADAIRISAAWRVTWNSQPRSGKK
jgi:hypothetical protein